MSEHEHHHDHDHDHDHHDHDHDHEHEHTSLDDASGCAEGLQGTITGWNADAEARMAKALTSVGEWVVKESGCLLGHVKAAVVDEDGKGITLNLTDMETGVEHHGTLEPMAKVRFTFMCAVVDVDEHELKHRMFHAIDDTGLDYELDEAVECHCHDHDHDHHDHGHHHDDDDDRRVLRRSNFFKKKSRGPQGPLRVFQFRSFSTRSSSRISLRRSANSVEERSLGFDHGRSITSLMVAGLLVRTTILSERYTASSTECVMNTTVWSV